MRIRIRKATPSDWAALQRIQKNDGFKHAYYLTRKRLSVLFRRGEVFFIAYAGIKPVGFAGMDFEVRAVLHFLSVLKTAQGAGVGSLLMKKGLAEAKKRKYREVIIFSEKSWPLERFLAVNCFVKTGFHKNRFGKGKHATIWSRAIK